MRAMPGVLQSGARLGEGLIAPSPPGVVPVNVEQELSHRPSARCQQADGLPDTVISGLPWGGILIEVIQLPEFILEQRLDLGKPGRWPDLGIEPGKVPARHHEPGEKLITAHELPHPVFLAHKD